jgi:hypothetical protein
MGWADMMDQHKIHQRMLDPLETRLSYSMWNNRAMWNRQVRELLMLTFGRSAAVNFNRARFQLSATSRCPYCRVERETVSHLLCGCPNFKGFYTKRANEMVQPIGNFFLKLKCFERVLINTSSSVHPIPLEITQHLPPEFQDKRPDIILFKGQQLILIECAVTLKEFREELLQKITQYQPLALAINSSPSPFKVVHYGVMLAGMLGTIPRLSYKTLRRAVKMGGLDGKAFAKAEQGLASLCQRVSRGIYQSALTLVQMRKHQGGE